MERNEHFEASGLSDVVVHLAWAQLEIFADDVDKIQVLVAGDDQSVHDLRVLAKDGLLLVEQPQYGLSLNLMEGHWMQVCVRMPRAWQKPIHVNTISGLLSARGLQGSAMVLDSVSGDLRAVRLQAQELKLKTVSGDVRAEDLRAASLSVRSVSGNIALDMLQVDTLRCNSVSGEQTYHMSKPFQRVEINTVSGDVIITSPVETLNVGLRSLSGRVRTEGVSLSEDPATPAVRITGISANLKLISIKE